MGEMRNEGRKERKRKLKREWVESETNEKPGW